MSLANTLAVCQAAGGESRPARRSPPARPTHPGGPPAGRRHLRPRPCFGPRPAAAGFTGNEPVAEHSDRGEMLFHGRDRSGVGPDVGGHVERRDVAQPEASRLAPPEELPHRPPVRRPRPRVRDPPREELCKVVAARASRSPSTTRSVAAAGLAAGLVATPRPGRRLARPAAPQPPPPVEPHRLPAERSPATAGGGQAPTFRVTGRSPGRPRAAPRRPLLRPWPAVPWRTRRPPPAGAGSVVNRCGGGCSAVADAPSAPASSASPAPDGLPANEVPQVERKGPRGGRSRGASGVARTPGPTWVGHPAGAALESAPGCAIAARRFGGAGRS